MKICIVAQNYMTMSNTPGGGNEVFSINLARLLKSYGHDVEIWASKESPDYLYGIKIIHYEYYSKLHCKYNNIDQGRVNYKNLISEVIKDHHDYDFVVNNFINNAVCDALSQTFKNKVIHVIHGPCFTRSDFMLYRSQGYLYEKYHSKFMAVSKYVKSTLPVEIRDYCLVHHSFININHDQFKYVKYDERENRCINVARVGNDKNTQYLIDILKRLDYPMLVIGQPDRWGEIGIEIENNLRELIKQKPNIKWIEHTTNEEVLNYVANSKLFIQANKAEGFSLAVSEATLVGTPVYVASGSAAGGVFEIREILNNTDSIYFADNYRKRYEAKIEIAVNDIKRMIENCTNDDSFNLMKTAQENFSIEKYYNEFMSLVQIAINDTK